MRPRLSYMLMQFNEKCVGISVAFRPDLSVMLFDDVLSDGKAQTQTSVSAPGLVYPVKPAEYVGKILLRQGHSGIGNCQAASIVACAV